MRRLGHVEEPGAAAGDYEAAAAGDYEAAAAGDNEAAAAGDREDAAVLARARRLLSWRVGCQIRGLSRLEEDAGCVRRHLEGVRRELESDVPTHRLWLQGHTAASMGRLEYGTEGLAFPERLTEYRDDVGDVLALHFDGEPWPRAPVQEHFLGYWANGSVDFVLEGGGRLEVRQVRVSREVSACLGQEAAPGRVAQAIGLAAPRLASLFPPGPGSVGLAIQIGFPY